MEFLDISGNGLGRPVGSCTCGNALKQFLGNLVNVTPALKSLCLDDNELETIYPLVSNKQWTCFQSLSLRDNPLGVKGARELAAAVKAGNLTRLSELRLAGCRLNDVGLTELLETQFSTLEILDLEQNGLTPYGGYKLVRVGAEKAIFPQLRSLQLGRNKLGDEAALFIASGKWCNIQRTEIRNFKDVMLQGLVVGCSAFAVLAALELGWLPRAGTSALLAYVYRRHENTEITCQMIDAWPRLQMLSLDNNAVSQETKNIMARYSQDPITIIW